MQLEPGPFIPLGLVKSKLLKDAYGITDLVNLDLFYNYHAVRRAMKMGQLEYVAVNARSFVISRDQVLEYWSQYRAKPFEPAENSITVNLTLGEVDFVSGLVKMGSEKSPKFSTSDLFRNMIDFFKSNIFDHKFECPKLFITH